MRHGHYFSQNHSYYLWEQEKGSDWLMVGVKTSVEGYVEVGDVFVVVVVVMRKEMNKKGGSDGYKKSCDCCVLG